MDDLDRFLELLLYTALAGACIPLGAGLAEVERIRPQCRNGPMDNLRNHRICKEFLNRIKRLVRNAV